MHSIAERSLADTGVQAFMRVVLFALLVLGAPVAHAQTPPWRLLTTSDPLDTTADRRLVLAGIDRPAASHTDSARAALILACSSRVPGSEGKSLLFLAGQPMEPFGDQAYLEIHTQTGARDLRARFTLAPAATSALLAPGKEEQDRLAFIGDLTQPYFSSRLFHELLAAQAVTIRYRAFGEERTVVFRVGGLAKQLSQLDGCHWPT